MKILKIVVILTLFFGTSTALGQRNHTPSQHNNGGSHHSRNQQPSNNQRPAPSSSQYNNGGSHRSGYQQPQNNQRQTPQATPQNNNSSPRNNNQNYHQPQKPAQNSHTHHQSTYNHGSYNTPNQRYNNRTVVHHYTPKTIYNLPTGYHRHHHHGTTYSYYNGFYYRPYNNYYVVCRPPRGFVIGAAYLRNVSLRPVIYAPTVTYTYPQYYYSEGTYYVQKSTTEYEVISPPIGAIVESIPNDCEEFVLDGQTYYKVDDTYYKVTYIDGVLMYEVVGKEVK
jgi:hypothetical protein